MNSRKNLDIKEICTKADEREREGGREGGRGGFHHVIKLRH